MSEVRNHNWQDNSEQAVALPTPPGWEAQLHRRAAELYAQRNAPLRAEIERLQVAFNEISARLVEQTTAAVSEQETAGLLDQVKQWFSDARAQAEEDFQTRLAQARQQAEQDFESRLAQLRSEGAAQRPNEDEMQQRWEQTSAEAAREIEELRKQVEASRKALTMTAASSQAEAAPAGNFELLKTALEEIDAQRTQSATLTALLRYAALFAPRVAFFVVKGGAAVGWKAIGFENGLNDETVKLLNVPTEQPTLLRAALISAQAAAGRAETPSENSAVLGSYGSPAPARALAVPLVVRGKAAAVLYADSGTQSEKAINNAALETLLRAASMSIELLPARRGLESPARPVAPQPISQANAPALAPTLMSQQPAPTAGTTSEADSRAEAASPSERRPSERRPSERRMDVSPTNPFAPEAEPAPTAETESAPAPVVTTERTTEELPPTAAAEDAVEMEAAAPVATPAEAEPAMAEAAPAAEIAEEETDEPSAPTLADAPRPLLVKPPNQPTPFDSFAPTPPIVRKERARFTPAAPMRPPQPISAPRLASESEQRAHNDARRFARLLVSEIKLYNATKVNEGRRGLDLYERLRDEIDRSRKVYDKRVAPAVAARFDYFYDELVQTLAEGDAVKLGANCPGPVVLSS